jgi:glycosyltransferase involved in cell wall biosynthesis
VHWISKKIYIAVEKFLGQKTEAIINISQNEARVASKYKVQAKHYNSTILSCVRDTQYTNLAPLFKVNQEKINIGFMGRFDQQKGFDFLLNQTFINSNNKLVLYVVGDFDREKNNKKLPLPQYPNIIHLGWIDHTRVDDYISQLDALIIPSRWEGFGLVTIEAMRNSKAIIISNRGALNEMVIENYNGYIFSLDTPESLENIINKLKKPELLRMGQNSRKIYEQSFSGNRQNQEINELYEKVLSIV